MVKSLDPKGAPSIKISFMMPDGGLAGFEVALADKPGAFEARDEAFHSRTTYDLELLVTDIKKEAANHKRRRPTTEEVGHA